MFLLLLVGAYANLLNIFEQQIEMSSIESQETLKLIIDDFDNIPRSRFLRLYGQYIYYGLENEDQIDYARALYYFKQAADLGDVRAHFYVSLMTFFNLDGSYSLYQNAQQQSMLYRYVKEKYMSISLVDLYFSAIQSDEYASVAMGFRHFQGIGVNKNCSSASLFYLRILERLAYQPIYAKYVSDSKEVAKAIYDSNFYMNHELDIFGHAQIFENLNLITYDSLIQVKQLAQSFYYGLNGLERNYTKAYQLYLKMYEQLNDRDSGIKVAQMHLEGIVQPNYEFALKILNSIETKDTDLQGKIYNALGYIYFKGLGVTKNVNRAQEFFRKSAETKNSDGMFNLGSMYMLPSTLGRERDLKKGINLIQQAASYGHSMAQYSLALILLDGVDYFQSCDLAASLLHSSASRGPWADSLKTANYLFQQERYPQSLVKYFEASYTGFVIAMQNAAVIIEQNDALYFDILHFSDIQNRLDNDLIYKLIGKQHDAFNYIYSDYLQFVNKTTLYELLQSDSYKLKGALQLRLLQFCSDQKESICQMKLGDYYYNGKYEEIDYKKAISLYKKSLQGSLIEPMKAHVYFNLGIINALGQGVNINRTRAIEYFELSITTYSVFPIIPISAQVQILDYCLNVYRQIDQFGIDLILKQDYLELSILLFNNIEEYFIEQSQTIVNFIIVSLIIILFGFRLKLVNKQQ